MTIVYSVGYESGRAPVNLTDSDGASERAAPQEYPVIATAHLRLRAFELTDVSRFVAIANEHHVSDSTIDVPDPFTADYVRPWVESHASAWQARHSVHWAVSLLADDRLVGYTGLHNIERENRRTELSFWIGSGMERRGYGAEAAQAALAFAFATLEMNRVCAFHLARNLLAGRILQAIGLQQEGLLRKRVCKWDQFEDVIVRGILRSDWLESL